MSPIVCAFFGLLYSNECVNMDGADKLPFSIRYLLESAIRNCDNFEVLEKDVETILDWEKTSPNQVEIAFKPARVLLQVTNLLVSYLDLSYPAL